MGDPMKEKDLGLKTLQTKLLAEQTKFNKIIAFTGAIIATVALFQLGISLVKIIENNNPLIEFGGIALSLIIVFVAIIGFWYRLENMK